MPLKKSSVTGSSVEFDSVSKRYGSLAAVEDFSLSVKAGEFISLLGPSGSGKTTLLMMLAGFETASSGTIRVGERDITHVPPNKRDIGLVFQRYALFPHLTVAQNIAFPLRMRGQSKAAIAESVGRAIELVRLEGMASRLPNELSGGQQQRVSVARALVYEPSVLMMDEPLGALDKKLREQMQIEIKQLHQSLGLTVIYVTHDQDEALTMSDRIAVLHKGRAVQVASPTDLYLRPETPFVADFVGKMNFINGTVRDAGPGGIVIETADGSRIEATGPGVMLQPQRGDKASAALRPEQLRLSPMQDNSSHALPSHALKGRIEGVVFIGALCDVFVRVGDAVIHVHMFARDGRSEWRENDEVLVTYEPGDVRLFQL